MRQVTLSRILTGFFFYAFILFIFLFNFRVKADEYVHNDFSASGTVAVQQLQFSNVPNNGTFSLVYTDLVGPHIFSGLNFNATSGTVQTKLRLYTPLAGVSVTGSIASNDMTVAFNGVNGPVQNLSSTNNLLTIYGTETIHFSGGAPATGNYALAYNGVSSGLVSGTATSTTVQVALRTIPALAAAEVTGLASTDFTVAFKGVQGVPGLLEGWYNTTSKTIVVARGVSGDATTVSGSTTTAGVPTKQPTTSSWVELSPSLGYSTNYVTAYNSTNSILLLGKGVAGSEVGVAILFPSQGLRYSSVLGSGERIAIKSVSGTPTSGFLDLNFDRNY